MNHDILKSTFQSMIMHVYKVLYDEYKNEDMAKKNTLKIAKEVLTDFGLKGDITRARESLMDKYIMSNSEQEKLEIARKIEVLQQAISIIKGAD